MYSAKPHGNNFKNLAKPFSGIIYLLAGLFGNENEIYIVFKAF